MNSEEIKLMPEEGAYKARIDFPDNRTGKAILFMPGISSGPWGSMFDELAEKATKNGYLFLRFESWTNAEDLQKKTLGDIHREMDAAIEKIKEDGCTEINIVGKSFGGGVSLSYIPDSVKKLVLWAPAVGVKNKSNINYWINTALKNAEELTDIAVGHDYLKSLDLPIKIIHGTNDTIISLKNSEEIIQYLQKGTLSRIEGAEHSYNEEEHKMQVIKETLDFLT
ncbi:MAG: dienelactone hydrolase family protein [Candidatus Nanohaloarchaea archaeon]|nr:dienelactone hydrolase family protein [Candidatus Nanohaloarchaea archaeon]